MAIEAPKLAAICDVGPRGAAFRRYLVMTPLGTMDIVPPAAGGGAPQQLPSLPIVPQMRAKVGDAEREKIARLAEQLLLDEPALDAISHFGPRVTAGIGPGPCLVLEDHSAISLFERVGGDISYSYRALLLAGEGDLVAVAVPRSPRFEAYCRNLLGLGKVEVLNPQAGNSQTPLAVRCARDSHLLQRVAEKARQNGGLNIVPYMGTGGVWALARKISEISDVDVRVVAPPPRLTRRANDKLWFTERAAELFGPQSVPPTRAIFGLAALARRTAMLAKTHAAVAIKLPDSAGSAGNIVLDSVDVSGVTPKQLHHRLRNLLRHIGWSGHFPLMIAAWESPVVASPSVQLWIPTRGSGEIVIEGIFDQLVLGKTRVFQGAAPTSLTRYWRERLAAEAARLGLLFQKLGYFGRCSFDAILVGSSEVNARLHWIECNGRWGGTSIPMTLANRLVGDWRRCPFVVIDRGDLDGPGKDLSVFLDEIGEDLYIPGRRNGGVVLLSPGQVERGTGFEIMVMDRTLAAARERAERLSAKLAPTDLGKF